MHIRVIWDRVKGEGVFRFWVSLVKVSECAGPTLANYIFGLQVSSMGLAYGIYTMSGVGSENIQSSLLLRPSVTRVIAIDARYHQLSSSGSLMSRG